MICQKCGSEVPEGGFLCRNCGNDCRGFLKDLPAPPKKLVYKDDECVPGNHVGGFVSVTDEAINYGYSVERESSLDHVDSHGKLYNPKKKKLKDEVRPYSLIIAMSIISLIVLGLTIISVVWMFLYAEEIGDVAQNVFVTEFIKALAVAVGMIGLSLSSILFWLSWS